jgi:hypothetical protein
MEKGNELLTAVREIGKCLDGRMDQSISNALAAFEGIAHILDAKMVIESKCRGCDSYAPSSFPVSYDLEKVDNKEFCYARKQSLESVGILKLAGCRDRTIKAQEDLMHLARAIVEEDIAPAFAERKLYDEKLFANCKAAFRTSQTPGNVCIEIGHESKGGFMPSDIRIHLLRRLDPGFGPDASLRIAEAMDGRPLLFVAANKKARRQMDIDYLLEWIAKKRKMDIVYL